MNIVFIFNDFSLHNHIIQSYINKNKEHIVSIVRVPLVLKNQNRLETAKKIFPKISYRFILEKLKEYFATKLLTLCPKFLNKGEVFRSLRGIAKLNYYLTTKGISFVLTDVIKFISESRLSPLKQDSEAGNYYKWPDSQAVDELYSRGYQIVKLSDIFDILTGRYDGTSPCDVKIYTK